MPGRCGPAAGGSAGDPTNHGPQQPARCLHVSLYPSATRDQSPETVCASPTLSTCAHPGLRPRKKISCQARFMTSWTPYSPSSVLGHPLACMPCQQATFREGCSISNTADIRSHVHFPYDPDVKSDAQHCDQVARSLGVKSFPTVMEGVSWQSRCVVMQLLPQVLFEAILCMVPAGSSEKTCCGSCRTGCDAPHASCINPWCRF
jgi:hypothetical protein